MVPTRVIALVLTAVTGMSVLAGAAYAQSLEQHYKGKQIKLISSSDVGGGYDASARLLARFWGNHIPGNPQVIAQNMPGAGVASRLPTISTTSHRRTD